MKTVHYIENFVFVCTAIWSVANCGSNYSKIKLHDDKNEEVKYPYPTGTTSASTIIRSTSERFISILSSSTKTITETSRTSTSSTPIFYTTQWLTTSPPLTSQSTTPPGTTTPYPLTYVWANPVGFIPSLYPNKTYVYQNVDMAWCIEAPFGLLIESYTFSLTDDCCFLRIYDGCDYSSPQIAQYTGNNNRWSYKTHYTLVLLRLVCTYSYNSCRTPFVCDFSAGCFLPINNTYEKTAEEQLNALEPNNFPINYAPFDIIYNLAPGYSCHDCVMVLVFFSVNIGIDDYIILYDNIDASTYVPPVAIYNGRSSKFQNYLQPYVPNQKRNLIVRFTTSTIGDYAQLNISYSLVPYCFNFDDKKVEISSWNYQHINSPNNPYKTYNETVQYFISTDEDYYLSLYLSYFNLYGTSTLYIYDGWTNCEQPGNLIQKIGPDDYYPIMVQSETNKMTIRFATDAYGGSFESTCSALPTTMAPTSEFTSSSTPITQSFSRTIQSSSDTSPPITTSYPLTYVWANPVGFIPSPYPNNTYVYQDVDMGWCVEAPYGLLIETYTFSLTDDCCFLRIYDDCNIYHSRLVAQYTGKINPNDQSFQIHQTPVFLRLSCSSLSYSCRMPFVCDFSAGLFLPINYTYQITVEEQFNTLEPKNFPYQNSPLDIIYNFAPDYSCQTCVIALVFFWVHTKANDYIILYDNIYGSTCVPPVVTYNGDSNFKNYLQPYNPGQQRYLSMRFTSTNSYNDEFNISYSSVPYCFSFDNENMEISPLNTQYINSPNYPSTTYNETVQYCISTDEGNVLSLYLVYFYLNGASTLYIYDGCINCEQTRNLIQKFGSHDNYHVTVQSNTNKMTIRFITDTFGGIFESTCQAIEAPPTPYSPSNVNIGLIIGLTLSTAAVLILVVFPLTVYCFRKRRLANLRNRNSNSQASRVGLTNNNANVPIYESTPVHTVYENVPPSAHSTNIYANLPSYESLFPNTEQ